MNSIWNTSKARKALRLVHENKITAEEAAERVGCSPEAVRSKLHRSSPEEKLPEGRNWVAWTVPEKFSLYTMRTGSPQKSFPEIATALNRTGASCKRCWEETNWEEFLIRHAADGCEEAAPVFERRIAQYALDLARWTPDRLNSMTKSFLLSKIGNPNIKKLNFDRIMEIARAELNATGALREQGKRFGAGTYIIVGDSHGKHTPRGVFRMLLMLKKMLKGSKVIHVGHLLDDDNDVSCCWKNFPDALFVAKNPELKLLCQSTQLSQQILKNHIFLGDLLVGNQEMIQDYTMVPIGNLPRTYFQQSSLLNLHRMELETRTTCGENTQIFSCGCLCDPHIVKTIKQIDWKDFRSVKLAYHDGFIKYQKMEHLVNSWERGLAVVQVAEDGSFDVWQSRIFRTSRGFACSFFDKIVTEEEVLEPQEKTFFFGDTHCSMHDPEVLDLAEQFCQKYAPHNSVNLGDFLSNQGFNHHEWSENHSTAVYDHRTLDEIAHSRWVIERICRWANTSVMMLGNHERFLQDFARRFPQLKELVDPKFMLDLDRTNIRLVNLKRKFECGGAKFIHGDMKLMGARGGNRLDKMFSVFGANTIAGHSHTAAIRQGCYLVGLSGKLDQGYNEVDASRWIRGFGIVNRFEGFTFVHLIHIRGNSVLAGRKMLRPQSIESWNLPDYKASIRFDFKSSK